jgi:hypothetical protein
MEYEKNIKAESKAKNPKSRCVYCRKCYNSGLCMMPWPGMPASKSKEAFRKQR